MTGQDWYYERDGNQHGPVTFEQLGELAASGDLRPDDLVWTEANEERKPANAIDGLFPAEAHSHPPALPTSRPSANAEGDTTENPVVAQLAGEASRPAANPTKKTEAAVTQPLETITNSIGMKLALIPAGEFMMGSPDSDESASAREKPKHRVEITKPFYLGVYPVTQAEYEKEIGDNPSDCKGSDRRPVECVNWFEAVAFCNEQSKREGIEPYYKIEGERGVSINENGGSGYRLPTEAEWEYACRADTTTKWSFGDDESKLDEYAWNSANSGHTTHPVGEKLSNPWGQHDMHGNVWEWCWDWNGDYKDSPASDPSGPASGGSPVLRGGSFYQRAWSLRSANRLYDFIDGRYGSFGFRVARTFD